MPIEYVTVKVLPDGRMTTKDTAKYLGLSLKTLAMMRCKKEGPPFIKRGRIFYYKEDLDAWLAEKSNDAELVQYVDWFIANHGYIEATENPNGGFYINFVVPQNLMQDHPKMAVFTACEKSGILNMRARDCLAEIFEKLKKEHQNGQRAHDAD